MEHGRERQDDVASEDLRDAGLCGLPAWGSGCWPAARKAALGLPAGSLGVVQPQLQGLPRGGRGDCHSGLVR